MKKLLSIVLTILLFLPIITASATAEDDSPSFSFSLSVDGEEIKEVQTGDIITVVLKLHRTDVHEPYTMYAMQDEIRYDSTFFEIVDGGAVLSDGIVSTDISMVDQYREFYMNYLSMSGGSLWNADTLIGSFQLRVIGVSGVSKITNQDYIVSLQDGSGSYDCQANELTIVLSTDCVVKFMTNGGNEIENQIVQYGEKIIKPEDLVREGYKFAGWYKDIHLSEEWDFNQDIVQGNMCLYAKWIADDTVTEDPLSNEDEYCWFWWLLIILLLLILYIFKRMRDKKKKHKQ